MLWFWKCLRTRSNVWTFSSFTSMVPDPSTSNRSKASLMSCFWVSASSIFAALFFRWSELVRLLKACNKYTSYVTRKVTRARIIGEIDVDAAYTRIVVKYPLLPYSEPPQCAPFPTNSFALLISTLMGSLFLWWLFCVCVLFSQVRFFL